MHTKILPITIFFGNQSYTEHVLSAAKHVFPDLHVLHDKSENSFPSKPYLNYYSKDIDYFISTYKHYSSNPYPLELFCYLRWFFLRNYANTLGYDCIFHFDSDVMLCADAQSILKNYEGYNLCIEDISGHTSFFSLSALHEFCEHLLYFGKKGYERFLDDYLKKESQGIPTAISDMTALKSFFDIYTKGKTDHSGGISQNITFEPGYKIDNSLDILEISMVDGTVQLFNTTTKQFETFYTIHFQGARAKKMIKYFSIFYNSYTAAPSSQRTYFSAWLNDNYSVTG